MKNSINDIFGSHVFNDRVMREKLPKNVYLSLKKTIVEGTPLDSTIAEVVACAMKDWAVDIGATHYCHWFIPMTGSPAEKHNAFINVMDDQQALMEFSGKNLIKGESDASSFPSGGLRATFEARGYTAWDCGSPAFVKDGTLCIPTVFISYNGEALDKKAPLLRSVDSLDKLCVRLLRLLGDNETRRVTPSIGAEQEYFLIDSELYALREDLKLTGKTLFGAMSPKGQEMEDHYYGNINRRVSDYMADLDRGLWELGVTSKTKHNEVAPSQHELAPLHEQAAVACDHNHLTMEVMKKTAIKHGLRCLLNEKPFDNVNGSGKHVNYSLITNKGVNLFKPSSTIEGNKRFILFIAAVLRSIDLHADIMRLSIASAVNDHRLGRQEAPPAIISVFLGESLTRLLHSFIGETNESSGEKTILDMGLSTIPTLFLDNTDRNRTSPFAFTGDKFEFRMPGSSASIAEPCIMLNTALCDSVEYICERLENAADRDEEIIRIISDILSDHSRIIFNGDGYSKEWVKKAEGLGLPNFRNTASVVPVLIEKKNIELFGRYKVFSEKELYSRYEMLFERHNKERLIQAKTMLDMHHRLFLPASLSYFNELGKGYANFSACGKSDLADFELPMIQKLGELLNAQINAARQLKETLSKAEALCKKSHKEAAEFISGELLDNMTKLRAIVDETETILPDSVYPVPNYTKLLFSTNK